MILALALAAFIAVVTVWFLARAVRSAPATGQESYEGLAQLPDRLLAQLRELDVEESDRNVDAGIAADERRRLEAELAQVLKNLEAAPAPLEKTASGRSSRLWVIVLLAFAVVLPLVSAALYLGGNATVLAQLGQAQAIAKGEVPPMVLEMVARLERRLAEQPDDAAGWARLGRAYAVLGREQDADEAYARAYQIAPDNVDVVADYAAFMLSRDPTSVSPEALALFRKLHALDPQHPGALWALGLVAFHHQKFDEAVKWWEQLLKQLPPESEATPQVQRALEAARAEAVKAK